MCDQDLDAGSDVKEDPTNLPTDLGEDPLNEDYGQSISTHTMSGQYDRIRAIVLNGYHGLRIEKAVFRHGSQEVADSMFVDYCAKQSFLTLRPASIATETRVGWNPTASHLC